jgi:hypothetical protein
MMEPQGVPAGNLKRKFAGLLGEVCSAILSGCLALPLRPELSSPFPLVADSLLLFGFFRFALISSLSHPHSPVPFIADSHTLG